LAKSTPPAPGRKPVDAPDSGGVPVQPAEHAHHGYISNKDDYLKRLRRIEGQARGLQNMVTEEKYCIDILTQVSAMTSALESVALGLLNEHLTHCVAEAVQSGGDAAEAKIKEASDAIARLVRS
jgi:CsoR family transcriptional regulator, copper-sensing transcriptional repressor